MMKLSAEGRLRASVQVALATGAGAAMLGVAGPAVAEEGSAPTELEKVQVTGSRIRRVDVETASPILTIDRSAIQASGVTTIGELIQELPSMSGAATNPRVNNGGGLGASVVSLRGLGEQRTLVLVNGRRLVPTVSGPGTIVEGVDVNAIPINLIERVEVLKEGAGAIYGSDAIGGVVNFITRKDFNGGEAEVEYGLTGRQDGKSKSGSLSWGASTSNANLMLGLNYNKQDAVSAGNREFSSHALYLYGGVVSAAGSSRTPNGRLSLPASSQAAGHFDCDGGPVTRIEGRPGNSLDDYRCFTGADAFNYQPFNLLLTPQERAGAFVAGNYKILNFAEAYVEGFFNDTHSGFQIAPLPFDANLDDYTISADSIYNPFGVNFGGGNNNARYRMVALGNRQSGTEGFGAQVNLGLRGELLDTRWRWDAGFGFGRSRSSQDIDGYLFKPQFAPAIGPSFRDQAGVAHCGTPDNVIAGCTPVDIFNLPLALQDPAQAAQFEAASAGYTLQNTRFLREYTLNFNGPIVMLPAGELQAAVGVERREQHMQGRVDFLAKGTPPDFLTCQLAQETCTNETGGNLNVTEVYGEVFVPILAHLPGVHQLNFNAGIRYSDYSRFGTTVNSQFALEYRPIEDVLIRSTWAEVFRAPTITDLFLAITANAPTFTDPCTSLTDAQVTANPNLGLACQGVPRTGDFAEPQGQVTGRFRGNEDAKPEKGNVLTAGVVYDSSLLKGLSANFDFWRYRLRGTLEPIDVNTTAAICVQSGDPFFCGLIHRYPADSDSAGEVIFIDQPILNLGNIEAQGIDMGVSYRMGHTPVGRFGVSLDTSYLDKWDRVPAPGVPIELHNAGTFSKQDGNFARWRANLGLNWAGFDFDAMVKLRYIHSLVLHDADGHPDTDGDGIADVPTDLPIGSRTYTDFAVGYTVPRAKTHVEVGAMNVFDRAPPLLYQNNVINANTDVETYDTIGSFFFVKVTQKF